MITARERAERLVKEIMRPGLRDDQWKDYLTQRRSAEERRLIAKLEKAFEEHAEATLALSAPTMRPGMVPPGEWAEEYGIW